MPKSRTNLLLLCFALSVSFLSAQEFTVKEKMQPLIDAGDLHGFVTLVADKDKILQIDCFGLADVEAKRPMTPDTVFWMASQTKPVTSIAVMMLVDEGKLSLDEPVTTYLPELKDLRVAVPRDGDETALVPVNSPVTLRRLLCHTGGVPFISPMQQRHGIDCLPSNKALTSYVMTPLAQQPGTQFLYSNIGINIAATVVERVSGMPLEDFLEKRLFEPLGMKETSFWPTEEQIDRLAKAYTFNDDKTGFKEIRIWALTYPLQDRTRRFAEAGGGLFSTPNDWVRIYQMLADEGVFQGKRILSEAAVKEIRTDQTGELPASYGLGAAVYGNAYGHGGSHGTDSRLSTKNGRIAMYFIQEAGLPKAGPSRDTFFDTVLPP